MLCGSWLVFRYFCSLVQASPLVSPIPNYFPGLESLNTFFFCFRRHFYLYQCCCAEPRFGWSHDWPLTITGVYHVCGWPIGHQFGFCTGYPKTCHGRLLCLLGDGRDGSHCFGQWSCSSESSLGSMMGAVAVHEVWWLACKNVLTALQVQGG